VTLDADDQLCNDRNLPPKKITKLGLSCRFETDFRHELPSIVMSLIVKSAKKSSSSVFA
jgi:hypothetical protein